MQENVEMDDYLAKVLMGDSGVHRAAHWVTSPEQAMRDADDDECVCAEWGGEMQG